MRRAIVIAFAAGVAAMLFVLVGSAASSSRSKAAATWPPEKYRYTGWLSPSSGDRPLHAIAEGDGAVLNFDDEASLGTTRYRVCWTRLKTRKEHCAKRVQRSPRLGRFSIAGPQLRFGRYVARWYVGGRVVASWPFLYSPENG